MPQESNERNPARLPSPSPLDPGRISLSGDLIEEVCFHDEAYSLYRRLGNLPTRPMQRIGVHCPTCTTTRIYKASELTPRHIEV